MTKKTNTKKADTDNITYLVVDNGPLKCFKNKKELCEFLINHFSDTEFEHIQSYLVNDFEFYTFKDGVLKNIDPPRVMPVSITFEFETE